MERNTWDRVNELFAAAREHPPEEREAWVRTATADKRLQSQVLALRHAHEGDPWFADEPEGRKTPARVTPSDGWPAKQTPVPSGITPEPAAPPRSTPTPSRPWPSRRAPDLKAGSQFASYRLIHEIARDPTRIMLEAV